MVHKNSVKSRLTYVHFAMRRVHSFFGLWLVLYLCEHLFVNAQAAGLLGGEGSYFIRWVNRLQALPYIHVLEVVMLAVPFVVHGVWGVCYAYQSRCNAYPMGGAVPSLPYRRNRAFTWQRLTAWFLIVAILAHVVQMRWVAYPRRVNEQHYVVRLDRDARLMAVAAKIGAVVTERSPMHARQVLVETSTIGAAFFLIVRDTFKNPLLVSLYSLFVLAAVYHACNGLWTFLLTWGVVVKASLQSQMRVFTSILMGLLSLLGLIACWGSYVRLVW